MFLFCFFDILPPELQLCLFVNFFFLKDKACFCRPNLVQNAFSFLLPSFILPSFILPSFILPSFILPSFTFVFFLYVSSMHSFHVQHCLSIFLFVFLSFMHFLFLFFCHSFYIFFDDYSVSSSIIVVFVVVLLHLLCVLYFSLCALHGSLSL